MRIPVIIPNSNVHRVGGDYDVFSNRVLSTLEYNGAGVTADMTFKLPVGKTIYVNWTDGNMDVVNGAGAGNVTINNNYANAGVHKVIFTGHLDAATSFTWDDDAKIQGDLNAFSVWRALVALDIETTSISGDGSCLTNLTNLADLLLFSTSVTIDTSTLATMVSLENLWAYLTNATGDIADLITLLALTDLRIYSTAINTFTDVALPNWDLCNIRIENLGLLQVPVSNFWIRLDASSVASVKTVRGDGTNAALNAAGLVADASLILKGRTTIHN